ncbi:tight adherence pilus pseudopilin TadF [Marinomonas sp. 15G1-11]|uniref:Tight adherence pilus pseudopilin TadF n=1 Tax=Marinomonas phaeophyticola TaxID=3004091 RepID=A0ABT4JX23_9GAMM|nr:tight adherence pilus pseudopilin TadF [Marinomonas sp. 15G1-11]MCZ2722869.1 tight adherence pilus pseudopilin TadF [Marinomonas sp. 15G1-11]
MSLLNNESSKSSQRGLFAIEFALVGVFFAALLVFTEDVVIKQSIKGKLDRLSYSLVNIVRERTQLYNKSDQMSLAEANDLLKVATRSLKETMGNFEEGRLGLVIEQQKFKANLSPEPVRANIESFKLGGYNCDPAESIDQRIGLAPVSLLGRKVTLYQVTLCYQSDNLYGDLIGETHELVRSTSITVER